VASPPGGAAQGLAVPPYGEGPLVPTVIYFITTRQEVLWHYLSPRHHISTSFYILPRADDKEASTHQEKRYIQKKEEEKKGGKYLSRSTAYLVLDSGAYMIKKEREESLSANHIKKYRKRQYMEHV
jgi:hypothetical protein